MAKRSDRAERVPQAVRQQRHQGAGERDGWQKPWQPGERVLPHNFSTGRDYRGGNAVLHPVMQALDRGHVRKGERGTRIMYVESQRRVTVRDDQCQPDRAADGRP